MIDKPTALATRHDDETSVPSPAYNVRVLDDQIHLCSAASIASLFEQEGFVVLSQAIPSKLLQEWQAFSQDYFRMSFQVLHQLGHIQVPYPQDSAGHHTLGLGAKYGFREIVMRSPGRFELSLLNLDAARFRTVCLAKEPFVDSFQIPDVNAIVSALEPLLPSLLRKSTLKDLKLCHVSLLVAIPGSTDQAWHADGGHVSLSEHLPCHCVNIFVPLHDVPLRMGPTEFRPGGHFLTRNLAPMILSAKCRKTLRPPVWPALVQQDAVLFDYRVLHRGRANTTKMNRHVLVLTFCEAWFEDVLNFPKRSMLDPV